MNSHDLPVPVVFSADLKMATEVHDIANGNLKETTEVITALDLAANSSQNDFWALKYFNFKI